MWMREPVLLAELAKIGAPRVIELAMPMSATNRGHAAGNAVVATYGQIHDCIPEKSAFDLCTQQPLPPGSILAVHSETNSGFSQIGRGYPTDFAME